MPTPLIITLPSTDPALRDDVEARLSEGGNVYPAPPTYNVGAEEIKLIVEIAVGGVTFIKTLLEIKKLYAEQSKAIKIEKPGTGSVALSDADEALLRQLVMEDQGR